MPRTRKRRTRNRRKTGIKKIKMNCNPAVQDSKLPGTCYTK